MKTMTMKLTTKQINELITGVWLSVELAATSPEYRHFITVGGYELSGTKKKQLDRILDSEKLQSVLFWIRDYEVTAESIENDWDEDAVNEQVTDGIKGINALEKELQSRITDMGKLLPHWETDAPL